VYALCYVVVVAQLAIECRPWRVKVPSLAVNDFEQHAHLESRSLELDRKVGGKLHLKLNTRSRPIAYKYREGKVKSPLKRELKEPETIQEEASTFSLPPPNTLSILLFCGAVPVRAGARM
jgi:hypothetical protein